MPLLPRSYLFVPGDRPDRFAKALASGADAVVIDLEDAVAAPRKQAARETVLQWLSQSGTHAAATVALRTNPANSAWFDAELALCAQPKVQAVLLPKAERPEDLQHLAAAAPQAALLPLVESARGMEAVAELARAPQVQRLVFGTLDFAVDLGLALDEDGAEDELAVFRSRLTLVSRLASLGAPVDGVTTVLDDAALVLAAARRARRFGFGGKLCIHPRQIEPVHQGFAPGAAEVDWARRVLATMAAAQGAAVQVDGRMVDRPVLLRAESILAAAERERRPR